MESHRTIRVAYSKSQVDSRTWFFTTLESMPHAVSALDETKSLFDTSLHESAYFLGKRKHICKFEGFYLLMMIYIIFSEKERSHSSLFNFLI